MAIHPKTPNDLLLAPVAVGIDLNLQRLRDRTPPEIDDEIALTLNVHTVGSDRPSREKWLVETATRFVDLHHWRPSIAEDACRLRLDGGSVTLDLGLSANLARYIETGR